MKSAINRPALGRGPITSVHSGRSYFFSAPLSQWEGPPRRILRKLSQKGTARVGQTVRSKDYATLWCVMEEKEVWQTIADDPQTEETSMVPAIYLSCWKIQVETPPGVGRMMGFIYTLGYYLCPALGDCVMISKKGVLPLPELESCP